MALFLVLLRRGAGSVLRVGRERGWLFSANVESAGVEFLEFRPLLVSASIGSAARASMSSRLPPTVVEVRGPASTYSRASVLVSFLRGPSRGVDRESEGFASEKDELVYLPNFERCTTYSCWVG